MKLPIYLQILLGMILGIVIGAIALFFHSEQFVNDWIKPWGQIFIRLLQLVAVPLVFVSLIKGIIGLTDIGRLSKIGMKAVVFYFMTTVVAIGIGLSLAFIVKPGNFLDSEKARSLMESGKTTTVVTEEQKENAPLDFLNEIIPNNIISAASDNRKMLQVIFFALLFGVAALSIGREKTVPVLKLFDSLYHIILKMVDYVIMVAPFGVMALITGLVVDFSGDIGLFGALALYCITVIVALLFIMFVFYPLLMKLFTNIPVKKFLREMYPVQMLAFSTSSSAATLPLTMEVAKQKVGISSEVCSFILPIGNTVNMDGTSCFQTISVVFIAQVLGLDLSISQILTIVLMTTLSSIGTPSIPGGSYVILTMVLSSVGIPAQGLALILGVDRPLDMLRTSVNVTGDVTLAAILDKNHVAEIRNSEAG